ncbi:hypothetical protein C8A03DRAFT_45253 [Achaetomium macrosporum]|uniref:Apple domain-containing protein n=1 Tax=Achaetomium macrosporum TaxID=79813 RepID=A0AAN7C8N4_9PEZI|nr:hypothetical protein C8A03DRAFT_45253 [Achaetomium macrosporum]
MDQQQPVQQPSQYYPIQEVPREKVEQLQYQQAAFDPYYVQPPLADAAANANGPPAGSGPTVVSVTRGVALGVLSAIVLLLLLVIGLSAGLGVSQRDLHQVQGDLAVVQAALSSAVAVGVATTASLLPTSTSSAGATQTSAVASDVQCPGVNGTVYTASTDGKRFRRMCGIDYGGNGESVDIGSVKTLNLDACIDACATRSNCTGAGWGAIEGDKGPMHSCWMKTDLTKPHKATSDWAFAILLPAQEK